MDRTAVDPVRWSPEMGFNQGEVVSGQTRTLYISGRIAMSKDGRPEHDGEVTDPAAVARLAADHDGRFGPPVAGGGGRDAFVRGLPHRDGPGDPLVLVAPAGIAEPAVELERV